MKTKIEKLVVIVIVLLLPFNAGAYEGQKKAPTRYNVDVYINPYICEGHGVIEVKLSNSQYGAIYQVYKSGAPTGVVSNGTGKKLVLKVPDATLIGTYTITATYNDTGMTSEMLGKIVVVNGEDEYSEFIFCNIEQY